jgi:hypothetical protein
LISLSTAANTVYGQTATFTASVTGRTATAGTPTGTVSFFDGAALLGTSPLVNGKATLATAALSGGQHKITALYSGDATFSGTTSGVLTQVVVRAGSAITLSTPATTVPLGQPVQLTVDVSANSPALGAPTGTVTLKDGATVVGTATLAPDGTASFSLPGLAMGGHALSAVYSGDGNFVGCATGVLQESVGTPNQRYVNALYETLLGRAPDAASLDAGAALLDMGAPRFNLASAILNSAEFLTDQVRALYQGILKRDADPAGLNAFVSLLQAGWTVEQVQASLLGSDEFYTRAGGTVTAFVDALYQYGLGHAADPAAQTGSAAALAAGGTRYQMAFNLLATAEARQHTADGLYRQYLGRAADPTGLAAMINFLQPGGRQEMGIAGLVISDEFFGKV